MKRLLIDAGNTRIKLASVADGRWSPVQTVMTARRDGLADELAGCLAGDAQEVWVSNVAGSEVGGLIAAACAAANLTPSFIASTAQQCGVRNGYLQPAQLGCDRWAALIAAWHHLRRACLVVSCGTATTVDALSARGEFAGGLILPGMALMQCSLAGATAQLQAGGGQYADFPRNTADALQSGAIQASCGAIRRQHELLGVADAPVLLTGGAAQLLQPHLQLPVQMMDNLVLQGLLIIAQEAGGA